MVFSKVDGKIFGGTNATNDQFPYVVSIQKTGHACSGTIIDKNHILTAARHVDTFATFLSIQYGVTKLSAFENKIDVAKVFRHEAYDSFRCYNDIAILKLKKDITFGSNVQPVKLNLSYSVPPGNVEAVLAGWGNSKSSGFAEKEMKKIVLYKLSEENCKKVKNYKSEYHLCAAGSGGQCFGDAGGPLVINGVQYGIMSWAETTEATVDKPAFLTNVTNYARWIQETVSK